MGFKIRLAEKNEADFLRLADLLINHFFKEHEMGELSARHFDQEKVISEIAITLGHDKTWVAETDDGKIVGSIGLQLGQLWYTDRSRYGDKWFYVLPEYRSQGIATALIKQVKEFAKTSEYPITLGIYNMDDIERKIKFFQRAGLKLAGSTFYVGA